MHCHACGIDVSAGQRFCGRCGASLRGVTDVEQPAVPESEWAAHDPDWAQTGSLPTMPVTAQPAAERAPGAGVTESLPVTELIATESTTGSGSGLGIPVPRTVSALEHVPVAEPDADDVWAVAREGYGHDGAGWSIEGNRTAEMPTSTVSGGVSGGVRGGGAVTEPGHGFRVGLVTIASVAAAITALVGSFTTSVSITSEQRVVLSDRTPPTFRLGTWLLDDFGDNLSIAMLIGAVLLVVGGVAAGFRWRWGSGLAGGAGLAVAGLAALALGLAQLPLDVAKEFAAIPSTSPFTLTLTRDIGYWLLVVAGSLGVIVFFASLAVAFGDRRPGLNPWIAALGALATVVAVIGPMVPEGLAVFSDNWYVIEGSGQPSPMLLVGRLVQLALLLLTGVLGYLCVRRWGLALAIGGALPIVWLTISSLFDLTDHAVGLAYRNPGGLDAEPHGMTIIGVSALLAMALLAVVAAYDQAVRERRR